jgi:plastocyanin
MSCFLCKEQVVRASQGVGPDGGIGTGILPSRTSEGGLDVRRGAHVGLFAALAVAGLAAGIFVPGGGASSKASHAASQSKATTHVTVTATDFKFRLSKRSAPTGTVIFTVTNKGKIFHDFKIAGKKTPLLARGHSATLRVRFSKKGRYSYRSTVFGQAAAGMKGVFSIVTPTPTPIPTTTTPTTTAPYAPPTGPVGTANTTVTVKLVDNTLLPGHIALSQTTMPSGMVTFVITSMCRDSCNFDLVGVKAGAILKPGQSETWTVPLPPGIYRYHNDMFIDMKGSLTVTP